MVDMTAPSPDDETCDPACGTAGFLVAASEYVREHHPSALTDARQRTHFHRSMFHGYDFDSTMLRIGSMNMLLHGIERPDIRHRDSLSEDATSDRARYTLVLAGPGQPTVRWVPRLRVHVKDLQRGQDEEDRAALPRAFHPAAEAWRPGSGGLPDGVLFGSSKAHKDLRRNSGRGPQARRRGEAALGRLRPYAGVSTAILLFTKTNSGGTDDVWFYDVRADGFSLDDKRNPVEANVRAP